MNARATMTATVLTAAAVTGLMTGVAHGQNALGDGRALDNNLQQGSGGINQGVSPLGGRIDPNRVITGNVTGSTFFRDNVGYRAPGDFTDVSSDDELFRFRAVSQPSSIPAITSRTFGERLAPTPYYRDISGVTAGDVRIDGGAPAAVWRSRAAQDSLFDTGTINTALSQAVRRSTGGGTLGLIESDGELMEITASPLFGVSRRPLDVQMDDLQLDRSLLRRSLETPQAPQISMDELQAQLPAGFVEPTRWGAEPIFDPMLAEMFELPSAVFAPSVEIGLQLQTWNMQRLGEQDPAQVEQRVERLESSIFRPLETMQLAPGEDVYVDLLRMMREGTDAPAEQRVRPRIDLERPSDQQLDAAEQLRERALSAIQRGRGEAVDPGQEPAPLVEPPLPQPVEQLVQRLDAELPTVGTLAGSREDLANQHMREAEQALADGRYFDAERRYERVLRLRPNYPLARVGLMHAQLGAGMIRSAALNMRNIFAAHPELIAVRYDTNLLPSAERLQWVRGELDGIIERTEQQYPAIMLAYLGYQTSNAELVKYGLDLAQARDPADPLVTLLRRIWLSTDGEDAQPQDDAQPAPAEPADK